MRLLFISLLCLVLTAPVAADASRDDYPFQPGIDVMHYAFGLTLTDDSNIIEGHATVTVQFKATDVTSFALDLVDAMSVSDVRLGDVLVPFEHRDNRLYMTLPVTPELGAHHTFSIRYAGEPQDGLIISENRYGDRTFFGDNWPNRARHWLPTIDHPSDKATVEWMITAPAHYQVVGTGDLVEETNLDDTTRLTHWRTKVPIPTKVMVMGAARFAVQYVDDVAGIPVSSWVYPQDRDPGFFDYARAERVLQFFVNRVGPYPYEKLANVQSKTRYGGMENASNIFYNEGSVTGTRRSEGLIAHEVAHQWFGNSVSEADWNHIWLSEGFATYFTQLYLENAYGRDRLVEGMARARASVVRFHGRAPNLAVVDESITNPNQLLSANSYQKGGWILHMLRREVGDEAFWDGIQRYYTRYRDGNALTEQFRDEVETASGQDLDAFFAQWAYTPGHPVFDGTWTYSVDTQTLTLSLEQTQDGPAFSTPLDLGLVAADGTVQVETVDLTQRAQTITLNIPAAPTEIVLDPNTWLLFEGSVRKQ